jgi:hypothetical protein
MATILSISCYSFLIRSDTQALAAMRALADAIPVESSYDDHQKVWSPSQAGQDRTPITLEVVRPDQCRNIKPVPAARRLKAP